LGRIIFGQFHFVSVLGHNHMKVIVLYLYIFMFITYHYFLYNDYFVLLFM